MSRSPTCLILVLASICVVLTLAASWRSHIGAYNPLPDGIASRSPSTVPSALRDAFIAVAPLSPTTNLSTEWFEITRGVGIQLSGHAATIYRIRDRADSTEYIIIWEPGVSVDIEMVRPGAGVSAGR